MNIDSISKLKFKSQAAKDVVIALYNHKKEYENRGIQNVFNGMYYAIATSFPEDIEVLNQIQRTAIDGPIKKPKPKKEVKFVNPNPNAHLADDSDCVNCGEKQVAKSYSEEIVAGLAESSPIMSVVANTEPDELKTKQSEPRPIVDNVDKDDPDINLYSAKDEKEVLNYFGTFEKGIENMISFAKEKGLKHRKDEKPITTAKKIFRYITSVNESDI